MRPQKEMRNGRHFTHKTPESIGHTLRHIHPPSGGREGHSLHSYNNSVFFCYLQWNGDAALHARLAPTAANKFSPLQVGENSHGSLIQCGAEEGSKHKIHGGRRDVHTISAKERGRGWGRERRTDGAQNARGEMCGRFRFLLSLPVTTKGRLSPQQNGTKPKHFCGVLFLTNRVSSWEGSLAHLAQISLHHHFALQLLWRIQTWGKTIRKTLLCFVLFFFRFYCLDTITWLKSWSFLFWPHCASQILNQTLICGVKCTLNVWIVCMIQNLLNLILMYRIYQPRWLFNNCTDVRHLSSQICHK